MPQKVAPKSLQEVCLHNISLNIDRWSNKDLFPTSPFHKIPTILMNQIIRTLIDQKKQVQRHNVQALLVPHLYKLDVSHRGTEYLPFVLDLMGSHCTSITTLNVSYNNYISDVPLKMAIPSLLNLQEFNMAFSLLTSDVLTCLGAHSVNLKTLILTGCKQMTDAGIKSLCVANGNGSGDHRRSGQCRKLTHLLLGGTKVGPEGVRAALENLPALQSLQHCDTATVLEQIQKRRLEGNKNTRPLQDLYLEVQRGTSIDTLDLCLNACEKVTRVEVTRLCLAKGDILVPLQKTKGLVEFSVRWYAPRTEQVKWEPFHRSVMLVLECHLETLSVLHLEGFPCVNAELIGLQWSKITHLHLQEITTYHTIMDPQVLFPNLRRLEFHCEIQGMQGIQAMQSVDGSESTLKATLMSPKLTHVKLRFTASLTDQLMADVLACNKFEDLHEWEMEYCHNVTSAPIKRLLGLKNPHRVLKIRKCNGITQADAVEFRELKRKNKWDLNYRIWF